MRWAVLIAVIAACSFTHGGSPGDGPGDVVDTPPDMKITPTWAIDTASGKGVPVSTGQWAQLVNAYGLATSAPDHLWLMDETSGSLSDAIGSVSLGPLNAPTYANIVPGWSRTAVGTPDMAANEGFMTTSIGSLGTSYLMLTYVAVATAPAVDRTLFGVGAGNDYRYVAITANPVYKATGLGGVGATTGTVNPAMTVHPVVLEVDETHQLYTVYTDEERLSVPWTGTSGSSGLLCIGSAANGAADARYLYSTVWIGSHAELGDAQIKRLLEALGWTVSGF